MTAPVDSLDLEPLSILDNPDRQDVHFLDDRIYDYNVERTGITDGRLLAIFRRDDQNTIIAGLYGWTWGGCCEIKDLWVHEKWRGKGLGTLMMAAAEKEARVRGATQIVLTTHGFQAPDFYHRLGFESVGYYEDYPAGYRYFFLRKRIN